MRGRGRQKAAFRMSRPLVATMVAALFMIATILSPPAQAQLLHLDPLPFFTPADSTAFWTAVFCPSTMIRRS